MLDKYSREQFWKLFQKISKELQEAMLAEETANGIGAICERNEIKTLSSKVASCAGQVLIGLLPPDDFATALEKEVGLKKPAAKKVAQEINRHIFFPVRTFLSELYGTGPASSSHAVAPAAGAAATPAQPPQAAGQAGTTEAPSGKPDVYREPLDEN